MARAVRHPGAAIALVCLLLATGCGGDEAPESAETTTPPPAPAPETTPLPGFMTPLENGVTYTTTSFQPSVRLTVPEEGEWTTEVGDTPEHFSILTEPEFGQTVLALHRISRVYDPEQGGLEPGDTVPLEGGFAEWLAAHPHLRTSEQEPVQVLGRSGVQIDFETRSSPPKTPDQFCGHAGADCVPLYYDGLDTIAYGKNVKGRFIVVPLDDGGEVVIELYAAPATAFDQAMETLQPLLDSLEPA